MKVNNINVIKAVVQLMDKGGRLADELYAGMATDKEERIFLISDYNYPVNITVDDKGEITFTSERLKGAVKFEPGHDLPVKDAFAIYCEKMGLINPLFFHCSMMEKAIVMASFNNMIRQYDAKGGNVSGEELISSALAATMSNFDQAIKQVDPDMVSDEDSLVQAMIAAGMTPVREQQVPIPTETVTAQPTDLENTVKKIEALPVKQTQPVQAENHYDLLVGAADTDRAEKLIDILKNGGQLNNQEQELLVQLESIVGKTKARKERLTETLNDKSTIVANSVGRLLKSHLVPYGLHKRHLA